MVGDRSVRPQMTEPEHGHLREYPALARDRVGQDAVKRREPVRRHKEQPVRAEVKDLAHLAGTQFGDAGQVERRDVHSRKDEGKMQNAKVQKSSMVAHSPNRGTSRPPDSRFQPPRP